MFFRLVVSGKFWDLIHLAVRGGGDEVAEKAGGRRLGFEEARAAGEGCRRPLIAISVVFGGTVCVRRIPRCE
jgi:hypothetical protein